MTDQYPRVAEKLNSYSTDKELDDVLAPMWALFEAELRAALSARPADRSPWLQLLGELRPRQAKPDKVFLARCERTVTDLAHDAFTRTFHAICRSDAQEARQARLLLIATLAQSEFERSAAKPLEEYVTSEDAAKLLDVSRPSVAMLADQGKLGSIKKTEGGHRRIPRSGIDSFIREQLSSAQGQGDFRDAAQAGGLYEAEDAKHARKPPAKGHRGGR